MFNVAYSRFGGKPSSKPSCTASRVNPLHTVTAIFTENSNGTQKVLQIVDS